MISEVNQGENSPELPPGEPSPLEVEAPEQGEMSETGAGELESVMAQEDDELVKANARLIELEQAVASRDGDITSLKQSKNELEERLRNTSNSLAEAVASYKAVMVQANPEVVDELITGDTIQSINESLSRAKTLIGKVRQGLEAEISSAKVPAGAPERTSPDLSALSPREKIQYAIEGKR